MATTDHRRLNPTEVRRFGSRQDNFVIPGLTDIQTVSYERFLQYDTPSDKRKDMGLEGVLQEIFPVESYDKSIRLEYIRCRASSGFESASKRPCTAASRPAASSG